MGYGANLFSELARLMLWNAGSQPVGRGNFDCSVATP